MARRRALTGILVNFMGHFTSRYADYDGYWIFGLLVADLRETSIDLVAGTDDDADPRPLAAAVRLARVTFRDQLAKAGLDASLVREARVDIIRLPASPKGLVNSCVVLGYDVVLTARAVTDLGGVYTRCVTIFVAPHDPRLERRSTRAVQPT